MNAGRCIIDIPSGKRGAMMSLSFIFKKCPCCGFEWKRRDDFLKDKAVEIIGYQANFDALQLGLFLFNHTCGTTLAYRVDGFRDLYAGPIYTERHTGGPECLGYCLHRDELKMCPAKCDCAWVRGLMQIIKDMKV
jgi:hypothetical protein